jgi:hypothetical protein
MDKRMKISVWGGSGPLNILQDSLNKCFSAIYFLEVVGSDYKYPDIIYWVGGQGPSIKKYLLFWIKKNPIIINHWIGTDVTEKMEQNQHSRIQRIRNFFLDNLTWWKMKRGGLINVAVAPWLVDELAKLDIHAICLPITTIDPHSLGTVDVQHVKDIDFLSYVQLRRFDFYGGDKIVTLANRWKNYKFLIILGDLTEIPPDFVEKIPENVTISPRVQREKMPELYQRSKFFIRYTQHDGLSLSVLEALYYNLEVVWTYDFPYTHKIESLEKLSESIPSLVENWHSNEEGHAFVIEQFSIEKWRADFIKIIKSKLPLELPN